MLMEVLNRTNKYLSNPKGADPFVRTIIKDLLSEVLDLNNDVKVLTDEILRLKGNVVVEGTE